MKLLLLCVTLVALAASLGCSKDGSGNAGVDTRSMGAFDAVELDGEIDLELTLGAAHAVEIHGDDNLLGLVETKLVGERLIVRTTESVDPKVGLSARVSAPDVKEVLLSGVGRGRVTGVDNEELELELSGAGSLSAEGKTKDLRIEVSGAGSIDAQHLAAETAEVEVSGAGNVEVAEPAKLRARVSGAGNVRYGGSPEIEKDVSGAGSVARR
jgi:hypothetical protein